MRARRASLSGTGDGLLLRERPRLGQPILQVVDHDDAARTHQPGRLRGVQPDRTRPEHRDGIAFGDVGELGTEVAGGQGVGAQQCVLVVHPVRDDGGAHIGERHPDELRLPTVVPPHVWE